MTNNTTLSLIGLAAKAGKIVSGEYGTEKSVKSRKAFLVIVAADASDNTKKMFSDMCTYYKVPMLSMEDKESLGHAIGKEFRASIAVCDSGLAEAILSRAQMEQERRAMAQKD